MASAIPSLRFAGTDFDRLPSLGRVLRDPLRFWPADILHRPFVAGMAAGRRVVAIAEPRAVAEILLNRDGRFPRCRLHDKIFGAAYGENLIRGHGVDWRKQRRQIAQPMSSERAQAMAPRMELAIGRLVGEWEARPANRPPDLLLDARRLALDLLWRSFFCDEEEARAPDPMVDTAAEAIHRRTGLVDQVRELGPLAVEALRRQAFRRSDLGEGEEVDINTIRVFLLAGHDTTMAALCWALWLLAVHPDWQRRARDEWRDPAAPARHDAAACPITGAVVREALRLFPPIMQLSREIEGELEVAGEPLAPGCTAVLNLYAMQRSRLWWEEPDRFDPGRFLTGGEEIRRLAWLPFGTGPRGCIGAAFAQLELTLALGRLLGRFELLPNPEEALGCAVDWAVRPKGRNPLLVRRLD